MLRPTATLAALALMSAAATAPTASAVVLFSEDFENGTSGTTSTPQFSDGFGDYFTVTDGSNIGDFIEFENVTGSYFAASDIDGEGADRRQTLTFSGISVAGFQDLVLSIDAAEDDDADNNDWDTDDLVHASFVLDGVAPTSFETGYAIWFDGDPSGGTGNDNNFNSFPSINSDYSVTDGFDGDTGEVTDTFTTFEQALAFSGADTSVVDLVITFDLNSGDEDFAIDNITLTGNPIPEPASLALLAAGAGLCGLRRRR